MRIQLGAFDLQIGGKQKASGTDLITRWPTPLSSANGNSWWPVIRESFAGAWQRSITVPIQDALTHPTFFACVTLIASDISKCDFELMKEGDDGVKREVSSASFSPVLTRPNHYQNRMQFYESWVLAKLCHGNAYILKARDARGVVVDEYPLDPMRVRPYIAPNGDVYYACYQDQLAGIDEANVVVPAREIIHDRWNCLYHPLVGLSPVYASGASAFRALRTLQKSTQFLDNAATVGGLLVAPGQISEATAKKLEDHWNANWAGQANAGKIAVIGDNLKFEKMDVMTAVDAQVIEQLKWDDERICATFHVPAYMVNVGPAPTGETVEARTQQYYSQAIQVLVEAIELCQEEGLGAADAGYEIEFDIDDLVRMDSATKVKNVTELIKGGVYTPNEGRARYNLPPIKGGDTVYLQEQDHSLQWLAERDAQGPPPLVKPAAVAPKPAVPAAPAPKRLFEVDRARLNGKTLEKLDAEMPNV